MTVATIINSDLIPFRKRGIYQAVQNVLFGFGSICGASLGGVIADTIGWRWCFILQVPVSLLALGVGYFAIKNPEKFGHDALDAEDQRSVWRKVDIAGSALLILSLSAQLVALSLGGNELPWSNVWVITTLVGSVVLLGLFVLVEAKTKALPIIPLRMLRGFRPIATQLANVFFGMAAYAFLFQVPLFFQVVLGESASRAGSRLIIPSLATLIGGVIAGVVMSRWGKLASLVRAGAFLMTLGNVLVATFEFHDSGWKYIVYLFPANLGQGMAYPSTLFTFLAIFDHSDHAVSSSTVYLIRSLGTVWGVAITSAITQNVLKARLPGALSGIPDKWRVRLLLFFPVGTLQLDAWKLTFPLPLARSSTRFDTQWEHSINCRQMWRCGRAWCITKASDCRLSLPLGSLLSASLPRSLREGGVSSALDEGLLNKIGRRGKLEMGWGVDRLRQMGTGVRRIRISGLDFA